MTTYLTTRQKNVLRKVLEGRELSAQRVYPHPWRWTMEVPGEVGLESIEIGCVAALVEAGAGTVREAGHLKRTEFAQFVPDDEGARRALAEERPPKMDPAQMSWIPEGHPAILRRP